MVSQYAPRRVHTYGFHTPIVPANLTLHFAHTGIHCQSVVINSPVSLI